MKLFWTWSLRDDSVILSIRSSCKSTSLIPSAHNVHHLWLWFKGIFLVSSGTCTHVLTPIHGHTPTPIIKSKIKKNEDFINSFFLNYFIFYAWIFCLHEYLCTSACLYPQRPEQGIRFPGTAVTEVCEPCRFWELSPGSLGEELVLLATEFSLQLPSCALWLRSS